MTKPTIKEILKQNIPEFQRGSEPLLEYLDAAGEFLEETKEIIENFDNLYDYKKGTPFNVENSLNDRGYTVPSRINEETKRRVLRDVSELFLKNGTMDALDHAIRMAGLKPDIRLAWLPSPREVRRGFIVDPITLHEQRFDMGNKMYTEMLYGKPRVTPDGTFFYGYRYSDTEMTEEIGPLPIMGERYKNVPENSVSVSSTPYLVIRFDEGNKTIVTDPVVDPVTGEVYEYSTSEEFDLLNEVLQYLVKETHRPTTLRVVIIMYFMPLSDSMAFSIEDDAYVDTPVPITPVEEDEKLRIIEGFGFINDFSEPLRIGSHAHIGHATPLFSRYLIGDSIVIGDLSGVYEEITEAEEVTGRTFHIKGKDTHDYFLRWECELSITPPVGLSVYGYKGNDPSTSVLIRTVNAGQTVTIIPPLEYDVVRFVYNSSLTDDVRVDFVLRRVG